MSKGNRIRRRQAGLLPEPLKCHARKKDGQPCGNYAMHGQQVCGKHGGRASQNLAAAERRLAKNADVLMKELLRIATSAESEAVRLAAVRDALDRIGIGSKRELEVTVAPWAVDIEGLLYDPEDEVIDAEVVEDTPPVLVVPTQPDTAADKADHPPRYGKGTPGRRR